MRRVWGYAAGFWLASAGVAAADPVSAFIISGLSAAGIGTVGVGLMTIAAVNSFLINVALFAVTAIAKKLTTPKQRQALQERQASVTTLSVGENPPQAIYGRAVTAGTLLDAFNYGGQYGTDWEVLVICLAEHQVEALEGYYVGDKYRAFTANGIQSGYRNCLDIEFVNASRTAPPSRFASVSGGRWTSADVLAGRTRIWVAYKANEEVWPQGRPQFKFRIKGRKCVDPRNPGAGRVWTENAAVCRYDFQRGIYAEDRESEPGQLLVGRGLSEEEAPAARVISAANICDENVPLEAGGTEKRYRVGCVINGDEPFDVVEEMFASAMAGIIVQRDGGVEVEPGAAKSPVFEITDDDLVSTETMTFSEFLPEPERVNSIIPRYIEPAQLWKDHSAPIRRDLDDIAEDGGPLEEPLSLPFVTSKTQAGRCGEIARRLARLERRAAVTLGPRFAYVEDGDWGTYTSAIHTDGVPMPVRVEAFSLDEGWNNGLSLREISSASYGDAEEIADEAQTDGPYDGGRLGSVIRVLSRNVVYPLSSDPTNIFVAAHTATLSAHPWSISLPSDTFSSLANDTIYNIFWSLADADYIYILDSDTAAESAAMTNPGLILIGSQRTALSGGGYTPPETPPGGGGRCPAPDVLVMMANDANDGPGEEIPAGAIRVGDMLWTRHEHTGVYGAFRVLEANRHEGFERQAVVMNDGRRNVFATDHQFCIDGEYVEATDGASVDGLRPGRIERIDPAPNGPVIQFAVEDAHTLETDGLSSHNKIIIDE